MVGRVLVRVTPDAGDFWIPEGECVGRARLGIFRDKDVPRDAFVVKKLDASHPETVQLLNLCGNMKVSRMDGNIRRDFSLVQRGLIALHIQDLIRCGTTTLKIVAIEETVGTTGLRTGAVLPPGTPSEHVAATQADPDSEEEAGRTEAARTTRFSGAGAAAAAAPAPPPPKTMDLQAALPTPRCKGNKPAQNKRRRQRQAAELHALREKDPVAAARADAAATKAGREARLKADAHAAIAVDDLAAAAKCISQLEKLKKQKKKKKKTQKKDATAAGRTETLVGSAPSADAACAAGDTTGRQRLAALVTRMSNAPCPKGGSAIASVRVHKPTMMSREAQRYRVRVTAKTRRKPKSKEKRGQMRLLASETRHVLQGGAGAATEAAVRSAVHMLEAIDAGRIALRSVNAKMVRGY